MSDVVARLWRIGPPPDFDGDIILSGAIVDGAKARISLDGHDTLLHPELDPAGEMVLRHRGDSVIGEGHLFDSPRGRALRQQLKARGGEQQWSIGFRVLSERALTAENKRMWPDLRRIIEEWDVFETSPVHLGSCGPSCRTLSSKTGMKCAGACGCRGRADQAAVDRAIAEGQQLVTDIAAGRVPGVKEIHPVYLEPHRVALAENAATAAARDLGLSAVRVRFFDQKSRPHAAGFVAPVSGPHTIWLSAQLTMPSALVRVVGEEVRHLAQWEHGEVMDEAQARAYGERLARSDWGDWPEHIRPPIYDAAGSRI